MTAKLYIGVFMLLAGTLYSCQKDEEVNKLDADYRVMTDYDPETDLRSGSGCGSSEACRR